MLQNLMEDDTVVAAINGDEIRWIDIENAAKTLPEDFQGRLESVFPALLRRLIDLKLLAQAGRDRLLQDDSEVKERLKVYENQVIREVFLERTIAENLTDQIMKKAYAAYLTERFATVTAKARHILVGSAVTARGIIKDMAHLWKPCRLNPRPRYRLHP